MKPHPCSWIFLPAMFKSLLHIFFRDDCSTPQMTDSWPNPLWLARDRNRKWKVSITAVPLVHNGRKPPHCLVPCGFFLPPKSQSVSVHRGHLSIGWIFEFKCSSGFPIRNVFCFGPVVCRLLMHKQNVFFSGMLLHVINMHDTLTAHPFTS